MTYRSTSIVALLSLAALLPSPAHADDLDWPVELGDTVLFSLEDPTAGHHVYRTDGTPEGTFAVDEGCSPGGSDALSVAGPNVLYLGACFPDIQLWATDGSAAGTRRLSDVAPPQRLSESDGHLAFVPSLGLQFFLVDDPPASELWASDGSAAGTRRLAVLPVDANGVAGFAAVAGALVFRVSDESQPDPRWRLWRSDGTPAGTQVVGDLAEPGGSVEGPVAIGGVAVYSRIQDNTTLLFATDGQGVAAEPIAEIEDVDGVLAGHPRLHRFGGLLYFVARDAVHGVELWRTDGTAAGTLRLTDLDEPEPFDPLSFGLEPELWYAAGALHFAARTTAAGVEPWRTDGTPAGTLPLGDLCPGACSSNPRDFVERDGAVWLLGSNEADDATEIWRHQPAAGVTERLAALPRAEFAFPDLRLLGGGGTLYLLGPAPGTLADRQVWRLEADGSRLPLTDFPLREALPSFIIASVVLGDRLLFRADDGLHGLEPWWSDGTPEGTYLLADVETRFTATSPPPRPTGLRPLTLGADFVNLIWFSPRTYTSSFSGLAELSARSPGEDWHTVAWAHHSDIGASARGLDPDTPYAFRVRLVNAAGVSAWSDPTAATTHEEATFADPCTPGEETLCFADGRFSVSVAWRNQHGGGETGAGRVLDGPLDGRSGAFWFFRPDNVELIVKLLDGRPVNGDWWVFYGALSDVEYWLTVVDHLDQRGHTYYNPPGEVCGRGDTRPWVYGPLNPAGGAAAAPLALAAPPVAAPGGRLSSAPPFSAFAFEPAPAALDARPAAAHPFEPCVEDAETLCLLDRFRVRVTWEDQYNGGSGAGGALPFTDRSGFFWFFREDNVELVVKVLDGRSINGKIWLFYGALSDVGYEITVLDTADGHLSRGYVNPPGNLCGRADTGAF